MMISVLIVNWNTRNLLQGCLEALQHAAEDQEMEIILVDNASSDGSVAAVQQKYPEVRLVENQENQGFSRANNQAAALAQGEYLLLLNPDTELSSGSLKEMVASLERQPQIGAIGPRLENPDGSLQISAHPRPTLLREAWRLSHLDRIYPYSQYPMSHFNGDEVIQVDVVKGACILLRRQVYEQIGLFDEQFFVYSEEVDLCVRIKKAGWGIAWHPLARVVHYGGQSTKQAEDAMFLELYRNKVKFFRKHDGTLTTMAYKGLLYLTAGMRALTSQILVESGFGEQATMQRVNRQYRILLTSLPAL